MTLAVVRSRAIDGLDAPVVQVGVHLANGLPSFTPVGLTDAALKEARARAALAHSGLGFASNQRITVNLAPADLPNESGRFDLPIARTVADRAGSERIGSAHVANAMQWRRALPTPGT
jgi:magnesium chelatase family protein